MNSDGNCNPLAVVTGSTAGIGRAVALRLAREGYSVIITGRREESSVMGLMEEIRSAAGLGDACRYVRGDIADDATREAVVAAAAEAGRSLELLVNNAGITTSGRKDILELERREIERLFAVNLIAPLLLTRDLVPLLKRGRGRPCVINISSLSAYTVSIDRADYCISKAGMSMMTQLFAARLAAMNIGVFELRPGIVRTDMTAAVAEKYDSLIAGGLLPLPRWGEPEDVAGAVAAIAAGAFPYSTGEVINIDGGFHIRRL
ncbi:MAG: 3-ketoacyl-ACP reductase [Spirochaetes bacterium]|nr:3-ketoacyl-ACP reductase [Spirochaetota bacterium]